MTIETENELREDTTNMNNKHDDRLNQLERNLLSTSVIAGSLVALLSDDNSSVKAAALVITVFLWIILIFAMLDQ